MKKLSLSILFLILLTVTANVFGQSAAAAKVEYKRLTDLQKRLKAIPIDRLDREPHKSFIKRNEKSIVYSDPAGQWLVRSDLFWNLQKKYSKLPIAEDIAWTAAQNPIPGECEGWVNCYIYLMTETDGRYLKLYPNGKYRAQALRTIARYLGQITGDNNYDKPTEATDKADLKKMLGELRAVVSKVSHPTKDRVIKNIDKLKATIE